MESKPNMPFEYAKTYLAASVRNELADYAFGDSEVTWTRDGREVAAGYFGSGSKSLGIMETKQFAATDFNDDEARQLQRVGQQGRFDRNDAGDPREW